MMCRFSVLCEGFSSLSSVDEHPHVFVRSVAFSLSESGVG